MIVQGGSGPPARCAADGSTDGSTDGGTDGGTGHQTGNGAGRGPAGGSGTGGRGPEGPARHRWWTLAALVVAVMAVGLDGTVLNVALPTLAEELHATTSELQWFVAAYTLMLAAALLPAGLLGDRFGRRRMLLIALAVFGAGSVGCAFAGSPTEFIVARVVAGLGAALLVPVSLSVLTVVFDEAELPRAVGAWAAGNFLALPVGPILGGWVLSHAWWGWVFLVNVPVVLVGMVVARWLLPESRGRQRAGVDPVGILTSSTGLGVLTYGFIRAGQDGWGDSGALAAMGAGVAVLVVFARWELRLARRPEREPLVDLALFRSARFSWGGVLSAIGVFALFGVLFLAPQYFQAIQGTDAMGSGVRLLPLIAGVGLGAGLADRLAARTGQKVVVTLGFLILSAGMFAGIATPGGNPDGFVAAWTACCGLGTGLALSTAASAALAELSGDRAGVGSALMQTVQKAGAPLAVAVLGSVLNAGYRDRLPDALPGGAAAVRDSVFGGLDVAGRAGSAALADAVRGAFLHGMDLLLATSGGLALLGGLLAMAFLPGRRGEPASRTDREPSRIGT